MKKDETEMSVKKVIEWCDKLTNEGKEVVIGWEGGGDSGWIYMQVDGEDVSNEKEADWLTDRMYELLDYGSWAGDYSASGTATYDPKTKMFEGNDFYSEDTSDNLDLKPIDKVIQLKVPKKYYYDRISINLDDCLDGGPATITPIVRNGIISTELVQCLNEQEAPIGDKVYDIFRKDMNPDIEVISSYQTEEFNRNNFAKETETHYIYEITSLNYSYSDGTDRDVCIDLNDYIND